MTSPARLLALAIALGSMSGVLGCGGGSTTTGDAGAGVDAARDGVDAGDDVDTGGERDSGTAPDASGTGVDGGSPCTYVDLLDPFCVTDADCVVGLHQTDCCGNARMIGYATGQDSAYANGESACMASYPDCDCPAGLPTTDSGESVTDTASVRAACVVRGPGIMVCITYVTERPTDSE